MFLVCNLSQGTFENQDQTRRIHEAIRIKRSPDYMIRDGGEVGGGAYQSLKPMYSFGKK